MYSKCTYVAAMQLPVSVVNKNQCLISAHNEHTACTRVKGKQTAALLPGDPKILQQLHPGGLHPQH